jgi:hypothetical protein
LIVPTRSEPSMIALRHLAPLASGSTRLVFQHPDNEDQLIKVMKESKLREYRGGAWYKRLDRSRSCKYLLRELREQVILLAHGETPGSFLQTIFGVAATDLGPGLVVEALRGGDGRLAPSLAQLLQTGGRDGELRAAFQEFTRSLTQSRVVISALGLNNILYCWRPGRGPALVLIDGFGERTLIPVKGMFPTANRVSKARKLKWLVREAERRGFDPRPEEALAQAAAGGAGL